MFSTDPKRNQHYADFIAKHQKHPQSFMQLVDFGHKCMAKAKLHHHYFGDYTLKANALSLAQFALPQKHPHELLHETDILKVLPLFEKRIAEKIPVEYITGVAEYSNHQFYVNENVLVPRSLMNTRFQDFLKQMPWSNHRVLDLCTGSGCIGITLALLDPALHVDLADISAAALAVAQRNIVRHQLENRVRTVQSNLFDEIDAKYDLIITNPPYVSTKEYLSSPAEFLSEPKIALEAGKDGLTIIHQILAQAKTHLNPDGCLIAEIGFTAAQRVKKQYPKLKFEWFKYRRPNGHESWLGMHGVFRIWARDL